MSSKKSFSLDEAKNIGEQLGIKWDKFDVEQFRMGMDVELEHGLRDSATNVTGNDSLMTAKDGNEKALYCKRSKGYWSEVRDNLG